MAKILIIDDDPDIVEAIKVVLEDKKYDIVSASSGKQGLEKVKKVKPDLVILDVMMETGDKGFDVARAIKNNEDHKNIPILMLTALKEKTGLDFKKEAGDEVWLPVDDYCDKSIDFKDLILKVENLLKKR